MKLEKQKINGVIKPYIGFDLFTKDGRLNMAEISNREGINIQCGLDTDVQIEEKKNATEVEFIWDTEIVKVYVPEHVQKKVRFYVNYIFSEFDKINDNINALAEDINEQTVAKVTNACKILERGGDSNDLSSVLIELGEALEYLQSKITRVVNDINSISQNRLTRMLKTNIPKMLNQERLARIDMCIYIEGVRAYIEIAEKLGKDEMADGRMDDACKLWDSFSEEKLRRIDGGFF